MKSNDKLCALIDAFTDLAEKTGYCERATMESLLDIFDPDELAELGYEERVRVYLAEYGAERNSATLPHSLKELQDEIGSDLHRMMCVFFPSAHGSFPDKFWDAVIEDVYETSGWQESGVYCDNDISLAIQREVLKAVDQNN